MADRVVTTGLSTTFIPDLLRLFLIHLVNPVESPIHLRRHTCTLPTVPFAEPGFATQTTTQEVLPVNRQPLPLLSTPEVMATLHFHSGIYAQVLQARITEQWNTVQTEEQPGHLREPVIKLFLPGRKQA